MRGVSPALSLAAGTEVIDASVTLSAGTWRLRAPELGSGRAAATLETFLADFVGVTVVRCLTFLPPLAALEARLLEDRRVTCNQSGVWSITASDSVSAEDPSSILSES